AAHPQSRHRRAQKPNQPRNQTPARHVSISQAITETAYRADEIPPELAANAADINLDGVALDFLAERVQRILDLLFRHRRLPSSSQHFNRGPLPRAEFDRSPVQPRHLRFPLQLHRTDLND